LHSLVRRFLKTGIAFLTIGLGIGVWLVGERELVPEVACASSRGNVFDSSQATREVRR
jgi:hypothetical protein